MEQQALLNQKGRGQYSSTAQQEQQTEINNNNNNSVPKRHGRSQSLGASDLFGSFRFKEIQQIPGLPRSYSVNADGVTPHYFSPTELGRQELYVEVPFTAVFGLQGRERSLSQAFAMSAAEFVDMQSSKSTFQPPMIGTTTPGFADIDKKSRLSHASMIILDEIEEATSVVTFPLVCAIIVAGSLPFLVGYNIGVMNAPASIVFPGHTTLEWSLAVAIFAVGGPFGAFMGGKLADERGRRGALLANIWTFLIGGIIQTFAMDMFTVIIGRFIIGFASGYSTVLVPIYLGEVAPPTLRGMLGTVTQFALVIGILISNLMAFPTVPTGSWRILFSITPIISFCQLLLASYLLESPRWLLGRDPSSYKARSIIKKLRGLKYDHEVETELGHFVVGVDAQKQDKTSQLEVLKDMWEKPKLRKLLISSLVLQISQQLSGINAVFYYSTSFFEGVIANPLVGTTIVGVVNVLATYAVLFLMDRCGRRTLIVWSSGGMLLSCIFIVVSLKGYFNHIVALIAVNSYVAFFEFGLGPIPWLIVAEMFEAKYVAVAMSLSSQLNWACNIIVGLVFPIFAEYLGPYSFAPFALVLTGCFLYALLILPETQGTTPEQLAAEMTRTLSQNLIYQPMGDGTSSGSVSGPTGEIDSEWKRAMEQLQQEEEDERNNGKYDYGFKPIPTNTEF